MNYYNENDPKAAAWLRELIKHGHIADGDVDERSIEDVKPNELVGYTQCHFFAGIGVWSYALRQAGWPDDRPVWTGSCPCQPFSAAGKGAGFTDERHLWPAWHHLIRQCKPPVVFGEQVASKDGLGWLDLVQADLEGTGYTSGAVDLCAAGVGAPHIRQRLWFYAKDRMADTAVSRQSRSGGEGGAQDQRIAECSRTGELADARGERREGQQVRLLAGQSRQDSVETFGSIGPLHPGPTNGYWRNADWLYCTDGKWRPVEPGTFPLANGAAARVGRLRGYGNAIAAPVAQAFVESYMEITR